MNTHGSALRERLLERQLTIGTFLKTPSPIVAEVLALSSLDAFCVDVEHAPFGRLELDLCVAALRAANRPCIVRTADDSATEIRNALDSGANGVLVPHVTSAAQARSVVKSAHFGEGGRGFAGSSRAARFTTKTMAEHLEDSRRSTAVIVQIEDLAALDHVGEIAGVEGVDAVFIGRADLAVAMGKSTADATVVDAVRRVCAEASAVGTTVGMFTPVLAEIPEWRQAGASLFLLSSDQSMMLAGANELAAAARAD